MTSLPNTVVRQTPWILFGIPIYLDTGWFVIVALMSWSLSSSYFPASYPGFPGTVYWGMGTVAALLLFACILLHELGHSLVAKSHGIPVACVTLFLFGGRSEEHTSELQSQR